MKKASRILYIDPVGKEYYTPEIKDFIREIKADGSDVDMVCLERGPGIWNICIMRPWLCWISSIW